MSQPVTCGDCGKAVTLDRTATNKLRVTCDCDEDRFVKVAQRLPEEWSA